jgi:hypothetical protein
MDCMALEQMRLCWWVSRYVNHVSVSGVLLEMVAEGDGIRCWGGVDEVQVVVWLSNWEGERERGFGV